MRNERTDLVHVPGALVVVRKRCERCHQGQHVRRVQLSVGGQSRSYIVRQASDLGNKFTHQPTNTVGETNFDKHRGKRAKEEKSVIEGSEFAGCSRLVSLSFDANR